MSEKLTTHESLRQKPRGNLALKLLTSLPVILLLVYVFFHHDNSQSWLTVFDPACKRTSNGISVENAAQTATVDQLAALGLDTESEVKIIRLSGGKTKTLHGRFLHITDIHPDPLYHTGTSAGEVCHRGEPKDDSDTAARFGVAMNGCDSSMDLMNYTLNWIEKNLRDKIDFVVWTGDNIRHDNDRRHPRTESQIFDLNAKMASRFEDMFRKKDSIDPRDFDVNVIPSLGNNDVFPHNLFSLGPTLQTREVNSMWSNFIPQEQQRSFDRSTSYFVEVIPGKLAILSIETLYLYKANPLVDTCDSKKEPGYQLLLWLGYVLEELRSRNMKVWLSGHVPPLPKNYDGNCFHKFTLWTNEYRDVIIGGIYGHMNIDHFVPLDAKKSWKAIEKAGGKSFEVNFENLDDGYEFDDVLDGAVEASDARAMGAKPVNKVAYIDGVRETYYEKIASKASSLFSVERKRKKNSKKHKNRDKSKDHYKGKIDRYSIVNVAGSVIPTFNPSFRVWEYNTSGLGTDYSVNGMPTQDWQKFFDNLEVQIQRDLEDKPSILDRVNTLWRNSNSKVDKTIPSRMPADLPLGPAYVPQLFTPTRFVQYYADLEAIEHKYQKEISKGASEEDAAAAAFSFEVEYTSDDAPYPMKSLLTRDYLDLAVKLANDEKVWSKFKERAFVSTGYDD
ncbi:LAFA_0E14246g1_1 [Lachancea sp. 'fantastica']|nr:LAFA_0E14246g1_1 [Lachancea sp. 'fantastica']